MTSELRILEEIKSLLIREYANYKEDDDDTVLNERNVTIDIVDPDQMKDNVGVWLDARSITVDDITMEEDELTLSLRISVICKRDSSVNLRNKVFNIKDTIYRILRNNQDLGGMTDTVSIEGYNYYPQLFLEIGIVGMDIDVSIAFVEQWSNND